MGLFNKSYYSAYDSAKPVRSFLIKIIRIAFLSSRSFFKNECYLKSSLLTFYSLISIVPILAILFAIAKGFGFEEFLQKQIIQTFQEQKDVINTALQFAYAFIGNIKSQAIVGIGILVLFFSVFGLFENIEKALNAIWNVKIGRSVIRRSINYLTTLIVFPVIFIASVSITIVINSEVAELIQNYAFLKHLSDYVVMTLKLVPYVLMYILFCYIYIFTPNTKIHFGPRVIAGIIAGTIFQFWQILYIDFQVFISSYNVIYGSFAALPLFLIWMQVNFVILLYGAEIAAQIEGDHYFRKTSREDRFQTVSQKQLALIVLHELTAQYIKGDGPMSIELLSERLGISSLDVREVLNILEKAGIIAEISPMGRFLEQYQLIINPELYTLQAVGELIDKNVLKFSKAKETPSFQAAAQCLGNFEKYIKESVLNLTLKNFATL